MITATYNNGFINLKREIPADFMATISNVSPKLPKVMMLDNNIAIGMANGKPCKTTKPISLMNVVKFKPLPTISSIYNQKNCKVSIKIANRKVAKKGPINARITNISNFLNKFY